MMKWLSLFALITLVSCFSDNKIDLLHYHLTDAVELDFDGRLEKEKLVELSNPPNAWIELLRARFIKYDKCLIYKTPYKSRSGILQLIKIDKKHSCFNRTEDNILFTVETEKLQGIWSGDKKIYLGKKKKSLHAQSLYFELMDKEKKVSVIELSLTNNPKANFITFEEDVLLSTKKTIGREKDNYFSKTAKLCKKVTKNCEVEFDRCSECKYGSFEVVGYGCEQGGRRYCGIDRCGRRGQPACPKGKSFVSGIPCERGSKAGFCQPEYQTYCDENKVLVCR